LAPVASGRLDSYPKPAPGGFLVPARLIGVLEAKQTENGHSERNDRLIAVSAASHAHQEIESLADPGKPLLEDIEQFFVSYNQMHSKVFKPLGCRGAAHALKLVKKGEKVFHGGTKAPGAGKK
jgi:inorganic pyrophosphatase